MIPDLSKTTRHHLANQATPAFSLIRKVCSCGKASTAKQLAQHGKCAACALAAVRDAIMPGDFAKLQQTRALILANFAHEREIARAMA